MREEFDKLLLTGLLLIFCGMAWLGFRSGSTAGLASFGSDQAKEFGGALLGLITGHALATVGRHEPPSGGSA